MSWTRILAVHIFVEWAIWCQSRLRRSRKVVNRNWEYYTRKELQVAIVHWKLFIVIRNIYLCIYRLFFVHHIGVETLHSLVLLIFICVRCLQFYPVIAFLKNHQSTVIDLTFFLLIYTCFLVIFSFIFYWRRLTRKQFIQ